MDLATSIAAAALSSSAGWRELTKKIITLLMVVVAYRMDLILQIDYIKMVAIIAFTLNEAISIVENAGLIGRLAFPYRKR